MAAPESVTLDNLDGRYVMERKVSDSVDPILELQGASWVVRQAVYWATITLSVKQYTEADTVHIDIEQTLTGGFQGTSEPRVLDNQFRDHSDHIFGNVRSRSTFTTLEQVGKDRKDETYLTNDELEFLIAGWRDETKTKAMVNYVENDEAGWVAWGVWGFADVEIGGETTRRYARRQVVKKPQTGDSQSAKLFYDYLGPVEVAEEPEEEEEKKDDYISDI